MGRNTEAREQAGVDPHAPPAGRVIARDASWRGRECARVFGIDAAFHGASLEGDVLLGKAEFEAGGDADLLAHQIDACDHFSHRMLDLQASIHFDEVELPVFIKEFDGAGVVVAELAHGFCNNFADLVPHAGVECRRGSLFEDFLVFALERAVALAQMHHVAVLVAQHLDFDVARPGKVFLHIDFAVAERGLGFGGGHLESLTHLVAAFGDFHAAPAAAGTGFDQHRIANGIGNLHRRGFGRHRAVGPRHARDAGILGRLLGHDLVAHGADVLRVRADKGNVVVGHHFGELSIFRKEAIARMNGVGIGDGGRGDDRGLVEVAVARRRRADADGFVGKAHVHGFGIRGGVHRHGLDAHFTAGALNAKRDLAAVGDEDFFEH